MSSISAIREQLAESLRAYTGFQVSPYMLSNPTPPCVMISAAETDYDVSFDSEAARLWFNVTVVVPYTSDIGAQMSLDEYRAGDTSIRQTLEADSNSVHVDSAGPDTFYGDNGIGCVFRVEVLT